MIYTEICSVVKCSEPSGHLAALRAPRFDVALETTDAINMQCKKEQLSITKINCNRDMTEQYMVKMGKTKSVSVCGSKTAKTPSVVQRT
jgi:hypothetical protein